MVGIVIVSHSARLAEGVRELAAQMTQGRVPLAVAGGIDDPEDPIGTDAMKVMAAIDDVYSDDGVIVLMDLGSALLSAETALEFLPDERRSHVFLSRAPLVEGTMAAAVQAMIGAPMAQIIAEAESALDVKSAQLGGAHANDEGGQPPKEDANAQQVTLTVRNRLGLHARPAARFVTTAARFEADVRVSLRDRSANGKSINQIAILGVRQGDEIIVTATGPEAAAVLSALQALADDNFGDRDDAVAGPLTPTEPAPDRVRADRQPLNSLSGISASPGVAMGPAVLYRPRLPEVKVLHVEDSPGEWRRLQDATAKAGAEIDLLYRQALTQVGREEAAIFEAHLLFLEDPALLEAARTIIFGESLNAEAAWQRVIARTVEAFANLDDEYMRGRAADIEDVGRRVLQHLMGAEPPSLDLATPSILIAADLTPSDTARLNRERVLAICSELGGATAHSAILARALGIPAVVGLGRDVWQIAEGQQIAVDGDAGQVILQPDPVTLTDFAARREAWQASVRLAQTKGQGSAITRDGFAIEIAANIGNPDDVATALEYGAEGVGLFRTEFLFMDRPQAPTEEEQVDAYRRAARAMGGRPLIIRTLDIGGDKPLPWLDLGHETNPFLGWRAIRVCLQRPELFMPQLRAILRAAAPDGDAPVSVKIMFPMVGTVGEVRAARAMLNEARSDLRAEGLACASQIEVGIMIEVPAAVAIAGLLVREVDFFSIGTNDLTQYTMAADRGNARIADLASPFQPAVLRMIRDAATAAHEAGICIGMCGEMAGDPLATALLLGLGIDELSMSAPSIPAVKEAIRNWTMEEARRIASVALSLETAEAVRHYLGNPEMA